VRLAFDQPDGRIPPFGLPLQDCCRPVLARSGLALDRLGRLGVAALILGGAPTVLLASAGLLFAPAAHAGALFPGVMPLMTTILAALILNETFTPQKRVGFALMWAVLRHRLGAHRFWYAADVGHLLFLDRHWRCLLHGRFVPARLDGLHVQPSPPSAPLLPPYH
jgi:hypothetical protein